MNNINFGLSKRKEYTIDGDETRVIRIDTSDTGIIGRWHVVQEYMEHAEDKFRTAVESVSNLPEQEQVKALSKAFAESDAEMREKLNYLFDSDICTPIVGNGSLFRMINGEVLFMTVIAQLTPLYEAEIELQNKKSAARIAKHTAKYVKTDNVTELSEAKPAE